MMFNGGGNSTDWFVVTCVVLWVAFIAAELYVWLPVIL